MREPARTHVPSMWEVLFRPLRGHLPEMSGFPGQGQVELT